MNDIENRHKSSGFFYNNTNDIFQTLKKKKQTKKQTKKQLKKTKQIGNHVAIETSAVIRQFLRFRSGVQTNPIL